MFLFALLIAAEARRFVIVSSPENSRVKYWMTPLFDEESSVDAQIAEATEADQVDHAHPQDLIVEGLVTPMGIAVDQSRYGLYVADPGANEGSGQVLRYQLEIPAGGSSLSVASGPPDLIIDSVQARWLAVDSIGNLFVTDEQNSKIIKVDASQLVKPPAYTFLDGGINPGTYIKSKNGGPLLHHVIYDGEQVASVSSPSGIAVDNFRVFWANKVLGTQVGSIVQGYETPTPATSNKVTPISLNAIKVYGVCMSSSNIYYTDSETYLYGVKKYGGAIATISEKMVDPRGCSWDGDGTVYVADKGTSEGAEAGQGKVYSFPSNMRSLAPQRIEAAFEMNSPEGIAVFEVANGLAGQTLAAIFFIFMMQ